MQDRVTQAAGLDARWMMFNPISDQYASIVKDVLRVRTHPMIPESVLVGGFLYDVDTGLLEPVA